jgi:hypothetical protein
MKQVDYVLVLLFAGLLVFAGAVVVCAVELPLNEKLFGFLSGTAGMFSGAFFTWITKLEESHDDK